MDKTLDRILSLLPRNEAGKIQHGAKADLARSLGFSDGAIVSMWEKGTSKSYTGYLYEISKLYGVSIAWLRGETDEREPETQTVSAADQAVLDFVHALPPERLRAFLTLLGAPAELLAELDREGRQG